MIDFKEPPAASFARALAVLGGARESSRGVAVRKMISVIVSPSATDTRITPTGLSVLYPYRRKAFTYWPALAAPALHALLDCAQGRGPGRFHADADALSRIRIGRQATARWLWIAAAPSEIFLSCREATDADEDPSPIPLPQLAPTFAVFDPARRCPHCSRESERFCALEAALVCQLCGRSFDVSPAELAAVTLEKGESDQAGSAQQRKPVE